MAQPFQFPNILGGITMIINDLTNGFNVLAASNELVSLLSQSSRFLFQPIINGAHYGIINGFIYTVIEPQMYVIFSVLISFIIAFDFMEDTGELLGAPS